MRRWVAALAVWSLVRALPALAEEPAQPELLLFPGPSVSAATKHAQAPRDAPSSVTIVTREEIRRLGYRTLFEVLRSVPGLHGSYDRTYSSIGIRGFLRPGDYNDRILLLVNGHTYNDDVYQTALLGAEFGIDLEAIDHVEIVRGPGSALYGGNALFAVVNVITATAATRPGVHALVDTGSFGRKRGHLSLGHTFDDGTGVFASGSILDVDGHETLAYPGLARVARDVDDERAYNFFLAVNHGDLSFQAGANRREKQVPTGAFFTLLGDDRNETVDGRRFAELSYSTQPTSRIEVSGRAFYDGASYDATNIYGSGFLQLKNHDRAESDWMGGELRARWQIHPAVSLTVGAEYTWHPHPLQDSVYLPGDERLLRTVNPYDTWGVYEQIEWTPLAKLTLVGGLRFDRVYDRIDELSPRLGAIWHPWRVTTLKLLYGRAFRPPNLYERFYAYGGAGVRQLANPGLDPERIETLEGVLEQTLPAGVEATLSIYRNRITDLIDQVVRSSAGGTVLQYRNVHDVRAQGAEIEVRVPLPGHTTWRTSYALQEATSGGHLLTNSPKHLAASQLLFPLPLGVQGGLELLLVGPRRTRDARRLETAHLLNLTLTYDTPLPGLALAVSGYNLLNHTYPDPVGSEYRQDRIPQDGITFRAVVEYAY
jgi:outer membrane receptor for ferrienterochelin and colicins